MAQPNWKTRDGLTYAQCVRRRARIAAAVRGGMTTREAAAAFKVKYETVYRACRWHGVDVGAGGGAGRLARLERRREQMAKAVEAGDKVKQAARRFGVADITVRKACAELGVVPPPADHPVRRRSLRARAAAGRSGRGGRATPRHDNGWPGAERRMAEVRRLLLTTDLSYSEIGRQVGLSRQRVGQVMAASSRRKS